MSLHRITELAFSSPARVAARYLAASFPKDDPIRGRLIRLAKARSVSVAVSKLRPNPDDWPVRDRRYAERLAKTTKVPSGMRPLFVLSDSHMILDGHHRYRAAQIAGWKKLPVVFVPEQPYWDLVQGRECDERDDPDWDCDEEGYTYPIDNDEAVEQLIGWDWPRY